MVDQRLECLTYDKPNVTLKKQREYKDLSCPKENFF